MLEYIVENTTVDLTAKNKFGDTAQMMAQFRDEPWVAEVITKVALLKSSSKSGPKAQRG